MRHETRRQKERRWALRNVQAGNIIFPASDGKWNRITRCTVVRRRKGIILVRGFFYSSLKLEEERVLPFDRYGVNEEENLHLYTYKELQEMGQYLDPTLVDTFLNVEYPFTYIGTLYETRLNE